MRPGLEELNAQFDACSPKEIRRVKAIRWIAPNIGRLVDHEICPFLELEYLSPDEKETRWTRLDNPEMPDEFLQEFAGHVGRIIHRERNDHQRARQEWILDQIYIELGRRAEKYTDGK